MTDSVAWGDYDGDGDLDLAAGNFNMGPVRLYRNDGGTLTPDAVWSSTESHNATSVAWGDYDADGDLDLVVGNIYSPNDLYRNDGISHGALTMTLVWSSTENDDTRSMAWGDVDGDGDLDLAVGNTNAHPNRLYRNDGGTLTSSAVWSSVEGDDTQSVAWGDYDGDGDLDLAAGNGEYSSGQPNRLYRNDGGTLTPSAIWSSTESDITYSVAWGDYDSDGDLDLAVGNYGQPNRLYRNDGGALTSSAAWSSTESDDTFSVAWGDYDGDGDLDLAVGNREPNRLYRNDGGALASSAIWSSTESDITNSVAWGDYDGDGDLDLAVGNRTKYDFGCSCYVGGRNRVYRNDGGTLTPSAVWSSVEGDDTQSVAWGDYDGDGDLDLAAGNGEYSSGQPNRLYRNDAGTLTPSAIWSSTESDITYSVAWGDFDSDGDLDLVVGNFGYAQPVRLYRNDGGMLTLNAVWSSVERNWARSVAWGDVDDDGDLDLAAGNGFPPSHLYRNDGGMLTPNAVWSSMESDETRSVAWGDVDSDGDLDLAVGNDSFGQPNRLYRNDGGMLTTNAVWSSVEGDGTTSVAWGDYDSDGDLDLAVGNRSRPNRLYRNDDGTLTLNAVWSSMESDETWSVAWGDYDSDGDLDLAVGNYGQPNRLYRNNSHTVSGFLPTVRLARPTVNADFLSSPRFNSGLIPITYTLTDPQGDPVKSIRAWYSPNGGGQWLPAVGTLGTLTTNLTTSLIGTQYVFDWDVNASGFFGQSDNVVFRLQAIPAISNITNSIPGPYLYGGYASSTFPFRVRGAQVRVLSGTQPISNGLVYRLPISQTFGALPFSDLSGQPFHTDGQGYLQGRGELNTGDRLVALVPITATKAFTLYFTSAAPTLNGLSMYTITQGGVQTLTVSPANSLLLFNLDVSLEWGARQDDQFLSQLEHDLRRTSDLLYDWSNGQAALGRVNVYYDKEEWNDAHLRIYATNRLRPNAAQGGIVDDLVVDPITATAVITYEPGQINIGAVWNRYGEANGNLGEDWPRALAHEVGHFALFLDDDYLGLDANGRLIPIDTCTGTAMSDPYREDYSEFHPGGEAWSTGCANTLAARETGRWDWATITTFYPWLTSVHTNTGPSSLPLEVTQIHFVEPLTPTTVLVAPIFNLTQDGARVQPGASARAFLYQSDRAIDLGSPTLDQVNARGARVGDRLCVYEPAAQRLGCEVISASDEELALVARADWRPDIQVTPINSRTIDLAVNVAGLPPTVTLGARLYPMDVAATLTLTLVHASPSLYTGTFALPETTPQGVVQVWVNEPEPRRESVTEFGLGGGAAYRHGRGAYRHERGAYRHGRGAPAQSPDGQVTIFADGLIFEDDDFFALQAVNVLPAPLPGRTVVGQAYRVVKSANAPSLVDATIGFYYAGRDVPAGEENFMRVYFWTGTTWQSLPTTVDMEYNMAAGTIPAMSGGVGVYALMSSIEISLYGPGWDQFSYPVQATRSISDALRSIEGNYSIVYWYDGSDGADHWKIYTPDVPDWVNDLSTLKFAESYWISLTQSITLSLSGGPALARTLAPQNPPATYYGVVLPGSSFIPTAGMLVSAVIDGHVCGLGTTRNIQGQIVYTLNVMADGMGSANGCGKSGRTVTFFVSEQVMATRALWYSDDVWNVMLRHDHQVYLPLLRK